MANSLERVAPFEHYMLADDSFLYNMTCHIRFWFDGTFDRTQFIEALKIVLAEQPLFQSFIFGSPTERRSKLVWSRAHDLVLPWIDWQEGNAPYVFPEGNQAIDLRSEIGLRLFVRVNDGKTELTLSFHHSCSDAKSIFTLLENLLSAYAELKGGPKRIALTSQHLLRDRAFFGLTTGERLRRMWRDFIVLWKFFTMLPMTLAGTKKPTVRRPTDTYQVVRRSVSEELVNKVKQSAKANSSTLNDVLLRDLFMTLGSWNKTSGVRSFGRRITIAVPVCMRGETYKTMPASDFVSMHVLHVPNRLLPDPKRLLHHIHKVMKFVKSFEMGHTLVVFAMLVGNIPGGLVRFFTLPLSRATAVLTNLGVPFQDSPFKNKEGLLEIAGVTLTNLESLPPIRDKTRIAVSINSYSGDLKMTMRYDESFLDKAAAQKILDRFYSRIELTAAELSGPASASSKTAQDHLLTDLKAPAIIS